MSTFKCNKKKHASDYFRVINSETKAYILGYLVASKLYNYLYSGASVFLKRKESILNTVLNAVDKRTAQCRA